jgi:hypothetical protein
VSSSTGIVRVVLFWVANAGFRAYNLRPHLFALGASELPHRDHEGLGAELDVDLRVGFQVVVPVGVRLCAAVGSHDGEPVVRLREAANRSHALGTRPGADVVDEDQQVILEPTAHFPFVSTELFDDAGVKVADVLLPFVVSL